jgi:hypothetical protein
LIELHSEFTRDPSVLVSYGDALGEAAGEALGRWFTNDFIQMPPHEKGFAIGRVEGMIIMEIALLFLGPEAWIARGVSATAQALRASRLAREILIMIDRIPALRRVLDATRRFNAARETATVGHVATEAAEALPDAARLTEGALEEGGDLARVGESATDLGQAAPPPSTVSPSSPPVTPHVTEPVPPRRPDDIPEPTATTAPTGEISPHKKPGGGPAKIPKEAGVPEPKKEALPEPQPVPEEAMPEQAPELQPVREEALPEQAPGSEAAEVAAEQALKEFGPRAAKFLESYGDDFTSLVTHYGPDAAKLSDESIESFLKWKKGLSAETQQMFADNPAMWRNYTDMDPSVRNLLTLCQSPCVPPGATEEQAKRIKDLIEKHGLADDDPALKQYLHAQGDNLDKALDDIADAKGVADLRARMREADVNAAQARMKAGDANSPVRQLDETDEDYITRLKKLRDEINNDPTRSTADDLNRLEDIESRLKRAEDRLVESKKSLDPNRPEAALQGPLPETLRTNKPSEMTDSQLEELLDFFEARSGLGSNKKNAELLGLEKERRRIANEEIKKAKEAFDKQARKAKGAPSDEQIINDMLAGEQDHIWVGSKDPANRVFRTLDEMAEGGAVIKRVEAGPPKDGRPDLPFRGPEKHIGGQAGSRQIHYNADFYYNRRKYNLHIYFPE